ncbi:hypothetical protein [Helicobacter sp.]|nr:hypothetical protein [Helicobacter sp.]
MSLLETSNILKLGEFSMICLSEKWGGGGEINDGINEQNFKI